MHACTYPHSTHTQHTQPCSQTFPLSNFWYLHYAKTEGEGKTWSILSHEWSQCPYLGRKGGGGVPDQKNKHFVLRFEAGAVHFSLWNSREFGAETTRKGLKLILSIRVSSLPLSTLVDTDVIHMIKWTRLSFLPLFVTYCKQSKTGWWEAWECS